MKVLRSVLPVFVVILLSGNTGAVFGQGFLAYNQISFLNHDTGIGARAVGLGGAYLGVADDYSAIYWNPAGLGQMKSNEFFTSLTHTNRNIKTNFLGFNGSNSQSKTALGAIGYAYSVDVYQGSLVIAGGYNRIQNYNSFFGYSGFNPGFSYMNAAFESPVVPDRLTQDETVEIDGGLSQFTIAGAFEAAENMFVGLSFNYWTGENNYNRVYQEFDLLNYYSVYPDDFNSYLNNNVIDTEITGYDALIGALYKFSPQIKIAVSINTPRYFNLRENWRINEDMTFDDGEILYLEEFDDSDVFEYQVKMPFMFNAGLSYTFSQGLVAGAVNYTDWTQFQFRDDYPVEGFTKGDANLNIKRTLEGVWSPRAGVELILPNELKLRAGYALVPSPVKDSNRKNDRNYFSFGTGFILGGNTFIDIAYRRGWWETETVNDYNGVSVYEKHVDHKVFTTFSFRF